MTAPFLAQYRSGFDATWSDDEPLDRVRFVVLDSETTGLNPAVDRLVTIGAVAVLGGEIVLEDSFSALLQINRNTEAVTVHGITRNQASHGVPEPQAITDFLGTRATASSSATTLVTTSPPSTPRASGTGTRSC